MSEAETEAEREASSADTCETFEERVHRVHAEVGDEGASVRLGFGLLSLLCLCCCFCLGGGGLFMVGCFGLVFYEGVGGLWWLGVCWW